MKKMLAAASALALMATPVLAQNYGNTQNTGSSPLGAGNTNQDATNPPALPGANPTGLHSGQGMGVNGGPTASQAGAPSPNGAGGGANGGGNGK